MARRFREPYCLVNLLQVGGSCGDDDRLPFPGDVTDQRKVSHLVGGDFVGGNVGVQLLQRIFIESRTEENDADTHAIFGQFGQPLIWHFHVGDDFVDGLVLLQVITSACVFMVELAGPEELELHRIGPSISRDIY